MRPDAPLIRGAEDRDRLRAFLQAQLLVSYAARKLARGQCNRVVDHRADAAIDVLLLMYRPLLGDTCPRKKLPPDVFADAETEIDQ